MLNMSRRASTGLLVLLVSMSVLHLAPFFAHAGAPEASASGGTGAYETKAEDRTKAAEDRIVSRLESGIGKAAGLLVRYGYAILFLAIFVEGFGIPAPGQTLLMAASIDASRGRLDVAWVFALALLAAVAGNAVGYAVGRWGGHPLLRRVGVQQSRFARVESRFAKSGAGVLLIARFFDGLRQLNGIVAGLLEMPWKKFALWNTLGGALWTGVWGLGVYFLGRRMHFLHLTFKRVEPLVIVLTMAALASLLVYLLVRRGRSRRAARKRARTPGSRASRKKSFQTRV